MNGGEIAGRVVRRVAFRIVRGAVRRARPLALGVTAIAAAGVVGATGMLESVGMQTLPLPGLGGAGSRATAAGEPPSTAQYVRGQEVFDANMMWAAFSDKTLQALEQGGGSPALTQRQLDSARASGVKIVTADYVGSYPIPSGSLHFYVFARTDGPNQQVRYVPYIFTLDEAGKIDRVE